MKYYSQTETFEYTDDNNIKWELIASALFFKDNNYGADADDRGGVIQYQYEELNDSDFEWKKNDEFVSEIQVPKEVKNNLLIQAEDFDDWKM